MDSQAPHRTGLGLRGRLALFFVVIVVAPLALLVVVLGRQVTTAGAAQTQRTLVRTADGVAGLLAARQDVLGELAASSADAELVGAIQSDDPEAVEDSLQETLQAAMRSADFLVAVAPDGTVVADAGRAPEVRPGAAVAGADDIARSTLDGRSVPGAIVAGRTLTGADGQPIAFVAAGRWLDAPRLAELPSPGPRGGVATVAGDRVWASSRGAPLIDPTTIAVDGVALTARDVEGNDLVAATVGAVDVGGAEVVVWDAVDTGSGVPSILLATVLPAGVVAALLGWLIAGSISAPIGRAVSAARDIAAGRLDRVVPEYGGGPELEELAVALNMTSRRLLGRIAELERHRDELRASLSRLGETLSSSLDLDRTLSVVTETAMDMLAADRAALMLLTPEGDALYGKVGRGFGDDLPRLRPGRGRIGTAVVDGRARLVVPGGDAPAADDDEPTADCELLVPLSGRGSVLGVLVLLRDGPDCDPFDERDLETLKSFSAQAVVAVENVLLHEEAQRGSVTDPLTGLWNFRHFDAEARRELESAARFARPLSLVLLDIDHFKSVNDARGHQAGDEVLRELARRVRDSARSPDVVARYGGEEFVVLLPGAAADGALASAERIRERVGRTPVELGGDAPPVRVTCSIGVASFPEHAASLSTLIQRADAALYEAKAAGRDRVVVARQPQPERSPA